MPFETAVCLEETTYTLSPQIKKYTLSDLGFVTNTAGAYVYQRSLEADRPVSSAIHLKIVINKTLTGFKMSTLAASGTARVALAKNPNAAALRDMCQFYLDELVTRHVLAR